MIDFDKLDLKILHQFQGGTGDIEAKIYADDHNRIVKSVYASGVSTGYHCHEDSAEVVFILSGSCKVIHDGKEERLTSGKCHYCRKGEFHAIINDTDEQLIMYAVVCSQ